MSTNIDKSIRAEITDCNFEIYIQTESLKSKENNDVFNVVENPQICNYCGDNDYKEYKLTIKNYLSSIQHESYIRCCTKCHDLNCPIHSTDKSHKLSKLENTLTIQEYR